MRRVVDFWKLHESDQLKVGDFEIYTARLSRRDPDRLPRDDADAVEVRKIAMMLPGPHLCSIPLRPVPATESQINGGHSWQFDGNEEKPTLHPSVNSVGSWHGWIRAGRMVSC